MLSVTKLGARGPDYYLEHVGPGAEDYYLGHGEPQGRWIGSGTGEFGLSGVVSAADFRAVVLGVDPVTGEDLARENRRVPGFDLCFKAPKSVSLLFGLGERAVAGAVVGAHQEAVAAALSWFETETAWSRRGRNGIERVATSGFLGAAFVHRTSRAGDPHLHTHVVVANLVKGTDGRWATLDSQPLWPVSLTAGYLYQAHLRMALTQRLGVTWTPVVNGCSDIEGVPRALIDHFSQRHEEIEAELEAKGVVSAKAADIAARATRAAKGEVPDLGVLRPEWRAEARALGFDHEALTAVLHRAPTRSLPDPARREAFAAYLSSPHGLTERASTFSAHEVIRAYAQALQEGASVAEIEALTAAYLERPELRALPGIKRTTRARLYSTADLLALEARALRQVAARRDEGAGVVHAGDLVVALARRPGLSDEQEDMVRALCTSGHGIEAVIAPAGAGKTFTLDACREAWQSSGRRVIGAALSAQAARELEAGSGIPSSTIALLLDDLEGEYGSGLPTGSVLVVDEAAMVGTRTLARVFDHAWAASAKVVLVGDPYQLPEIEAGGLIRGIESRFEVVRLQENRRQRKAWERAALAELRHGQVGEALIAYDTHGRIVRGETAMAVRETMVGHWWAARLTGEAAVMLAARRSDVDDLNARARVRMTAAGRLSGPEVVVADRPFQIGDHVMTLKNAYALDVLNGTRGVVTSLDPRARTITLETLSGRAVTLPCAYLDAGHLTHAYALTAHKAQGLTTEQAFLLGTDDLYRELGYTGLSRGSESNRLYVVGGQPPDPDEAHPAPVLPEPDELVFSALERSHAQSLARDHLGGTPSQRLLALHAERRRLASVVRACPADPGPERVALDEAHRRAKAELANARRAATTLRRGPFGPRRERAAATARVEQAQERVDDIAEELARLDERGAQRAAYRREHAKDLSRAEAVEQGIEETLKARVDEVAVLPPAYLVDVLGEPPEEGRSRARWRSGAARIEHERAALEITDEGSVLGPEPASHEDRALWLEGRREIETAARLVRAERQLAVRLESLAHDPGMGIER